MLAGQPKTSTATSTTGKPPNSTVTTSQVSKTEAIATNASRPSVTTATTTATSILPSIDSTFTKVTASEKDDEMVDVVSVSSASDANKNPTTSSSDVDMSSNSGESLHVAKQQVVNKQQVEPIKAEPGITADPLPQTTAGITVASSAAASTSVPAVITSTVSSLSNTDSDATKAVSERTNDESLPTVTASLVDTGNTQSVSNSDNVDAETIPSPTEISGSLEISKSASDSVVPLAANTAPQTTSSPVVVTNSSDGVGHVEIDPLGPDVAKSTQPSTVSSSLSASVANSSPILTKDALHSSQKQQEDHTKACSSQKKDDLIDSRMEGVECSNSIVSSKNSCLEHINANEKEIDSNAGKSDEKLSAATTDFPVEMEGVSATHELQVNTTAVIEMENEETKFNTERDINESLSQKDEPLGDCKVGDISEKDKIVATEHSVVLDEKLAEPIDVEMNETVMEEDKAEQAVTVEQRNSGDQEVTMDIDVRRDAETGEIEATICEPAKAVMASETEESVLQDKGDGVINEKQEPQQVLESVGSGDQKAVSVASSETLQVAKGNVISERASELLTTPGENLNDKLASHSILSTTRSVGDVIAKLKENDFEAKVSSAVVSKSESLPVLTQNAHPAISTDAEEKVSLAEETQRILSKLLKKPSGEGSNPLPQPQIQATSQDGTGVGSTTAMSSRTEALPELRPVNSSQPLVQSNVTSSASTKLSTEQNPVMPPLAQAQPIQIKVSVPSSAFQSVSGKVQVIGAKMETQPQTLTPQSIPTVQLPLLAPTVSSMPMPPLAQVSQLRPATKAQASPVPKLSVSRPVAIAPAPTSTQAGIPIGLAASQISNAAVLKALATGNAFQSGGIQIIQASPGQFIIRSNVGSPGNQQQNQRAVLLGNTAIMLSKVGTPGQATADGSASIQKTVQNIQAGTLS